MEETREEDVKLVTDSRVLQEVIEILQIDILKLESLYRDEKMQLRNKRRKELIAKQRKVLEQRERPTDQPNADDTALSRLITLKSRLLAESKMLRSMKPSTTKNTTIVNLNLETELKETSENLKTLIEVAEEQRAEMKSTLERLDASIDRDGKLAEALNVKLEEKMQKLETDPSERNKNKIRVIKANIRKVKRSTTETWDTLAEFLHVYFPSVPKTRNERLSMQNDSESDENGRSRQYVQLSDMIQQLMNAHMSKTDNSYLKMSKTWYPEYVKMLLGRGICVRHPQRPNHIRLETYL